MSKRDARLYFEDIRIALERISEYTRGMSFDQFLKDQRTIDAVVRNIEILGEATSHLPKEIQSRHSDVPWHAVIGMRNKVAHEYFGVNLEILWQTIQEDLPDLKQALKSIKS